MTPQHIYDELQIRINERNTQLVNARKRKDNHKVLMLQTAITELMMMQIWILENK